MCRVAAERLEPRPRADHIWRVPEMTTHIRIRNTTIASVICTHNPMFPTVASIRSFQGYGSTPHAASMTDVVARFHQVSSSGTYSQPYTYAARIAHAVHIRKTWLRALAFALSHDPRNADSLLGPRPNPVSIGWFPRTRLRHARPASCADESCALTRSPASPSARSVARRHAVRCPHRFSADPRDSTPPPHITLGVI